MADYHAAAVVGQSGFSLTIEEPHRASLSHNTEARQLLQLNLVVLGFNRAVRRRSARLQPSRA